MDRYYYKCKENNIITYLGKAKKIPSNCVEITKEKYNEYKSIISSIPNRDGYDKNVTLYVDGTYTVEYIKIEEVDE